MISDSTLPFFTLKEGKTGVENYKHNPKDMKNIFYIGAALVVILVFVLIIVQKDNLPSGSAVSVVESILTGGSSTTTPTNLLTGDATTTTSSFPISGVHQLGVNLHLTASTTSTILQWTYEFSQNRIDFYGQDTVTTSGATETHNVENKVNTLAGVGTNAVTLRHIDITNVGANFIRFNFKAEGANALLHAEIIKSFEK